MTRVAVLSVALLMLFANAARAEVKLQWKIPDGAKSKVTIANKFSQTLNIAGMDVDTSVDQTIITNTKAGQRDADGSIVVTGEIESLKSTTALPAGVEIAFDSADPPGPQGTQFDFLIDVYKSIVGMKTKTTYGKDNRVLKVEFEKDPIKDLDEAAKPFVEDQFDTEYLKNVENNQRGQLPDKAVNKGDKWEKTITVRLGGGQTFTFDTTYTYNGVVEQDGKKLHAIGMKTTAVEYDQTNPNSPAQVSDSDLTVESSEGRILFDNDAGRIVEQQEKLHIKGDMTIEVGDNKLDAKLDLTFDNLTKVE